MAGVFDEGRNFVLDALFGQTQSIPSNYYIALLLGAPNDTATGGTLSEPVGNGYARAAISNVAGSWNVASAGLKTNASTIFFPDPTGDWGLINYYALTTASTGGLALFWGELAVARAVTAGTAPSFDAGSFSITASAVQPSVVT